MTTYGYIRVISWWMFWHIKEIVSCSKQGQSRSVQHIKIHNQLTLSVNLGTRKVTASHLKLIWSKCQASADINCSDADWTVLSYAFIFNLFFANRKWIRYQTTMKLATKKKKTQICEKLAKKNNKWEVSTHYRGCACPRLSDLCCMRKPREFSELQMPSCSFLIQKLPNLSGRREFTSVIMLFQGQFDIFEGCLAPGPLSSLCLLSSVHCEMIHNTIMAFRTHPEPAASHSH